MCFVEARSTSRVSPESGVAKGAQQVGGGSGGKQSVVTRSTCSRLLHLLRPGGGRGWFVKARSCQSAQAGQGCIVSGGKTTMEEIFTLPSH